MCLNNKSNQIKCSKKLQAFSQGTCCVESPFNNGDFAVWVILRCIETVLQF